MEETQPMEKATEEKAQFEEVEDSVKGNSLQIVDILGIVGNIEKKLGQPISEKVSEKQEIGISRFMKMKDNLVHNENLLIQISERLNEISRLF